MFTYQTRESDVIDADRVKLRPLDFEHHTAKSDLQLIATESSDGLDLTLEYASELFEAETAQRLIGHFATLLRSVIQNPAQPLSALELLTADEQALLLDDFNATAHELPDGPGRRASRCSSTGSRRTPGAPCVVFRDLTWSYKRTSIAVPTRSRRGSARAQRRRRRARADPDGPVRRELAGRARRLEIGRRVPADRRDVSDRPQARDPRGLRRARLAHPRRARRRARVRRPHARSRRRGRARRATAERDPEIACGVRDLHVGLDGETEGRRDRARQPAQLHGLV